MNIRALTTVAKKYNELPTQIAYHLGSMERSMVELATTGSLDPDPDAIPITDRVENNENAITTINTQISENAADHIAINNAIQSNDGKIAELKDKFTESPLAGKSLHEWADIAEDEITANREGWTANLATIGQSSAFDYPRGAILWEVMRTNEDNMNAIGTSLNSNILKTNDNTEELGSSPTPGKTLREWATDTQATLASLASGISDNATAISNLETSQAAQDVLLDDLTVAW